MRIRPAHLLLLAVSLSLTLPALGTPVSFNFGGADADLGYEVAATADGGFVAVGFTSTQNLIDAYVVKGAADGSLEWQRTLSLSDLFEAFYDVVPTADGGFVLVGSANVPGTGGDYRPWLVKLDAHGSEVWNTGATLTLGTHVDSGIVRGVELANGNVAVVGGANSMTNPEDPWVLIVDPAGHQVSFNQYPTLGTPGFGVATYVNDLVATSDGGFVATGYVSNGLSTAYLWKLDAHGSPQWDRLYEAEGFRAAEAVEELADGSLLAVGCDLPNCSNTAVLRTDATGHVSWFETYADPTGDYTQGRDGLERADGSILVSQSRFSGFGTSFFNADLLQLDANGSLQSSIPVPVGVTSTVLYRLSPTPTGGFLATGTVNDTTNPGAIDLLVLRQDGTTPVLLHADGFETGDMRAWTRARMD